MTTRRYASRFQCGAPDCGEIAHFESGTRAEQGDLHKTHGKWRCVRHTRPDEVLSLAAPRKVTEIASTEEAHGRYWGNFGFVSGPGFKAFAKDFPSGTILRVTAEIILPDPRSRHG